MTPLAGALLLAARGLPVFPLVSGGKRPAVKGWQALATTDRGTISRWSEQGCNFGVALTDYTVLDFDCKNGADGLREYRKNRGPLETTFAVKTPTGGMHLYYLGETRNTVGALAKGVDTRSRGGFVVAPGSTVDDKPYQVVYDGDIAPLPGEIASALARSKAPLVRPVDATARGYIAEGQRSNELTRWAGVLRGQGLTRYEMQIALLAINEYRCREPLDKAEVVAIADSISRKPFKDAQAVVEFTSEDAKHEVTENPPEAIASFLGAPPQRKWVIPDWLPEGETVSLYGAGSTGKSLLSVQLGLAVSTGGEWLGQPCEQMPVLYAACEDTREELHMRCARILAAPEYEFALDQVESAPYFLWSRVGRENDIAIADGADVKAGRFLQVLDEALAALHWQRGLLILDTVADVYLGSEIDRSSVNKFIKTILGAIKLKHNLTVLLLAHPSRSGAALRDGLSGSTAWDAAVRCRWWLHRDENLPGYSILQRVKSNYSAVGDELTLEWEDGRFRAVQDRVDPLEEALFEAMAEPGEHTLYHVAQVMLALSPVLGNSPRTVERKLTARFLREKVIRRDGWEIRVQKARRNGRDVRLLIQTKQENIYD